ncbi:VWA domain-containing protein [Catalinimonas sp. 4WD22]|uniref:vWA domain-containing protein n=1 Tax=Catalinimonas locisalis TaxID=3133978 RepID=UPI0031013B9D
MPLRKVPERRKPMFDDLFPIDWVAFHFLRPKFLWLMLPVAVVLFIGLLSIRQEIRWKAIIAPHLRPYVIQKGSEKIKLWMYLSGFVALSLGVLALAGPTWKKIELPGQELETPMVILLDLSQSMLAEDLQPSRLERAKFKIHDLLNHNPQARVALIGFAGTAHTIVPLTDDYDIILSHIDGLSPSVMPFPGSDLEAALLLADTIMSVTDAPGSVLILSDDFKEAQFSLLQNYTQSSGNNVQILAMNTEMGSEVPGARDTDGNVVYSALNTPVLSQFSSLEAIKVHRLTLDDSDVEMISKSISDNLMFTEQPEEKDDDWRDAGLLLVIPMAVFILLWFRKGWVLYTLSALLFSSCAEVSSFEDLWYTADYQGQRLSEKGEYEEAAMRYDDPMRRGVAYYKAGEYEDAVRAFSEDTTANGAYNLGLAYFQNGDTAAAMLAFGEALELDPDNAQAKQSQQQLAQLTGGTEELSPEEAQEAQNSEEEGAANNQQNDSPEDLGGGGQEATQEDMEKQRLEETVATDIRKAKEMDEVPEDVGGQIQQDNSKVLMRKVDDDPSLFLKRKFEYQVKKENIKPKADAKKW